VANAVRPGRNAVAADGTALVGSPTVTADTARTGSKAAAGSPRLGAGFTKLWTASTTSALGAGLEMVATPLLVATRTHNPLVISSALAIGSVPWLLFSLPGGVLVDRVDRRLLMIAIDWIRVVALGVLSASLILGPVNIPLLYCVLFVISTGETVFRSASGAIIPDVVPRELLERANGYLSGGVQFTAGLVAGPLGGFLFAVAYSLPFLANTVTYAVSAILIGLLGGSFRAHPDPLAPAGTAARRSVLADIRDGLRFLFGSRLLRTMAMLIGLLNVTLTAALSVLVLLARDRLHLGSVGYGALFTCMAVGGILGSAVGDRIVGWVSATWTIRVGLLVEAGLHLALATSHSPYLVGVAFFAFGIHGALWTIVASSLRQRLTPAPLLGRVGGAILFLVAGGNCVGALLGGALAKGAGLAAPYWVGFVVALAVTAVTWPVFNRADVAAAYAVRQPEPAAGAAADTTVTD
jgi:MFS family permease